MVHPAESHRFAEIGKVGAPARIPIQQRRASMPPITLDGVDEGEIQMWGGREEMLQMLNRRRETALADDTTVEAYDWAELAARILARCATSSRPS